MKLLLAHLVALFTITVWGVTFISTKVLLANLGPEEILFIRFFLGWLALWLLCPRFLGWQGRKTELEFCLAGLFGVTLYFLLENIALEYTYAANASVIVSTAPFFTALVDWTLFGGKRPGLAFYIGFLLAIAGIAMISLPDGEFGLRPKGDILALLAAIAWAFYSCITRKLSRLNLGSLMTTRHIFFYGLLLMLPVLAITGFTIDLNSLAKPAVFGNLLFLGILASAICFATWTFCLIRLGTARASAYIYLVPVITVLAAAIWLAEAISMRMIIGIIMVITGLLISEARVRKGERMGDRQENPG